MAVKTEEIGFLLVHGMGEQKPIEHLRTSAKELASFIASEPDWSPSTSPTGPKATGA